MEYIREHGTAFFYVALLLMTLVSGIATYYTIYVQKDYHVFTVDDFDDEGNLIINIYDR